MVLQMVCFDPSRADFRAFHFTDDTLVAVREVSYHLEGYGHTIWEAGVALSGYGNEQNRT